MKVGQNLYPGKSLTFTCLPSVIWMEKSGDCRGITAALKEPVARRKVPMMSARMAKV